MKKTFVAAAIAACTGVPALAAPCLPASLAAFVSGGACELVSGATVFHLDDFRVESVLPAGTTPIDPGTVSVTPFGGPAGLLFGIGQGAGAGELFGMRFGFSVAASGLAGSGLELVGAAAAGDAGITVIQGLCRDANYTGDPGICPAAEALAIASAFADPSLSDPVQHLDFPVTSFFDVFFEIAIDGGQQGRASLPQLRFEVVSAQVPEPAAAALVLAALGALAWSRRAPKPPRRAERPGAAH